MPALDWLPAPFRERSRLRELAPDECLFHQGETARAIFAIESGRLRLVRGAVDGRSVVLHTAHAGELFAEAALFSTEYHCDAAAEIDGSGGWSAKVSQLGNGVLLTVTASDPKEVQHIRALGFAGIMTSGSHHQAHHLAMAKGEPIHAAGAEHAQHAP